MNYKNHIRTMIIVPIFLLTCTAYANDDLCSSEGISDLRRKGWSIQEIKSLCVDKQRSNSPVENQNQLLNSGQQFNQFGQRCATPFGVCGLYNLPPAPIGTPCYCINGYTGMQDGGQIIR